MVGNGNIYYNTAHVCVCVCGYHVVKAFEGVQCVATLPKRFEIELDGLMEMTAMYNNDTMSTIH